MKKTTKVSIKMIAERADVSPGTASLVLNGRGDELRISKATQQHVMAVAKALRGIEETTTKIIAVFWCTEFADDMMGRFFMGMNKVLAARNDEVELILHLFDYDKLAECQAIDQLSRYSGVIISGATDNDINFMNQLTTTTPVVLINRNDEQYHFVSINNYEIGESVARLFCSRKHQKVGMISLSKKSHAARMRQTGFIDGCTKLKLDVRDAWIDERGGRDYGTGYRATKEMLSGVDKPQAIFVMSYGQVLGVIEAIKELDLRVPEDIEVITFGDTKLFAHYVPSISSVYIPVESLAESALNLLLVVMDNQIETPMSRQLYADYVFRQSCGGFDD